MSNDIESGLRDTGTHIKASTKNIAYENKLKNQREPVVSNKIHPNAFIETPDMEGGEPS